MTQRRTNQRRKQVADAKHYKRLEFGEFGQPGHVIIVVRLPIAVGVVAGIAADLFELSDVFAANPKAPRVFSISPGKIIRKSARKAPKPDDSLH